MFSISLASWGVAMFRPAASEAFSMSCAVATDRPSPLTFPSMTQNCRLESPFAGAIRTGRNLLSDGSM